MRFVGPLNLFLKLNGSWKGTSITINTRCFDFTCCTDIIIYDQKGNNTFYLLNCKPSSWTRSPNTLFKYPKPWLAFFFFIDYLPRPNAIKSWLGFVVDLSCPTNRKPWNCSVSFMFSWLTSLVWTCHMLINTFSPNYFINSSFFSRDKGGVVYLDGRSLQISKRRFCL